MLREFDPLPIAKYTAPPSSTMSSLNAIVEFVTYRAPPLSTTIFRSSEMFTSKTTESSLRIPPLSMVRLNL